LPTAVQENTMLPSERLAIAARLHVLLRRKTGRVTDTEWLAVNAEYAAEIVRFARERALEPGAMIQRAAFSAIISTGLLVLPLVMVGITPRIHDAQAGHAAHAQTAVHHRHRVVGAAHLRRAHRVEDGGGDVAGQAGQFVVGLELHAGLELFGLYGPAPAGPTMRGSGAGCRRPPCGLRRC
jgi:hypothetical protein